MGAADAPVRGITTMPRGGPNASWLDRRFQTDALEYLDRHDAPDEVKQKVVGMLDRLGTLIKLHEKDARAALDVVSDTSSRILELGTASPTGLNRAPATHPASLGSPTHRPGGLPRGCTTSALVRPVTGGKSMRERQRHDQIVDVLHSRCTSPCCGRRG